MTRRITVLLLIAAGCALGVALLAALFYGFVRFNRFDLELTARIAAVPGSRTDSLADAAAHLGGPVPVAFFSVFVIAAGVITRRPWHLMAGLGVILAANLTTQILKLVLSHPRLQIALGADAPVTVVYPSGHTTAALSVGFAAFITAPPQARKFALAGGLFYGCVVGLAVIVAGWHYVSDVAGATMVVGFWACLAYAALDGAGLEGKMPFEEPYVPASGAPGLRRGPGGPAASVPNV